jgi:hypothetical protein
MREDTPLWSRTYLRTATTLPLQFTFVKDTRCGWNYLRSAFQILGDYKSLSVINNVDRIAHRELENMTVTRKKMRSLGGYLLQSSD